MNGNGYFWKGLADSFSGFRDQQFKKELADRDAAADMTKFGMSANQESMNRASREAIAGQEHKDRAQQQSFAALVNAGEAKLRTAAQYRKMALEHDPYNMDKNSPAIRRRYSAMADAQELEGNAMLSKLGSNYGVKVPPKETSQDRFVKLWQSQRGGKR